MKHDRKKKIKHNLETFFPNSPSHILSMPSPYHKEWGWSFTNWMNLKTQKVACLAKLSASDSTPAGCFDKYQYIHIPCELAGVHCHYQLPPFKTLSYSSSGFSGVKIIMPANILDSKVKYHIFILFFKLTRISSKKRLEDKKLICTILLSDSMLEYQHSWWL